MGSDMKDEGGERIVHRKGAGKKESDAGRGHYELVSPLFMRRLALWLEKGAKKYDSRNWEKGIPKGRIVRALLRHTYEYLEGMKNEDHLAAIACNIMFLIHFEVGIERGLYSSEDVAAMQDLPNYMGQLKKAAREVTKAWDLLKDSPDQCVRLGCESPKWLDQDYCLLHCNGSREERLKDASKRYYAAKNEMDAIEKESRLARELAKPLKGNMEPLFICKLHGCETIISRDNDWCSEHEPRAPQETL